MVWTQALFNTFYVVWLSLPPPHIEFESTDLQPWLLQMMETTYSDGVESLEENRGGKCCLTIAGPGVADPGSGPGSGSRVRIRFQGPDPDSCFKSLIEHTNYWQIKIIILFLHFIDHLCYKTIGLGKKYGISVLKNVRFGVTKVNACVNCYDFSIIILTTECLFGVVSKAFVNSKLVICGRILNAVSYRISYIWPNGHQTP